MLRREIKCMKISCEEWKIWEELKGTTSKGGEDKLMGKIKRCKQCPREKIKHMRGEIKCEGVK